MKLRRKYVVLFLLTVLTFIFISCTEETTTTTTTTTTITTTTETTTEQTDVNDTIPVGNNGAIIPSLSDPNGLFLSTDDYDITYQDLYDEVKIHDGLRYLTDMVDLDLLSSYIDNISQQEIDNKILDLKYGTSNQAEIDALSRTIRFDMESSYENALAFEGYTNREDEYIGLLIARELYAIDQIFLEDNSGEAWYAGPDAIAYYYEHLYKSPVNAIKIRFMSDEEANQVLKELNLVHYETELRLYTGVTPLDQVPSSQIDESNTKALTEQEILEQFILIYNCVYGSYRGVIDVDSTLSNLLSDENLIYSYEELDNGESRIGGLIYNTLGSYSDNINDVNDNVFYTSRVITDYYNNNPSYYLALVLDSPEKADLSSFNGDGEQLKALIGVDVYNQLKQEIFEINLSSSSFISNRLTELRQFHNFDVYDFYLGVKYQNMDNNFTLNQEGHLSNICTYDNVVITADELLTRALELNSSLYTIYAAQGKAVIAAHYDDVYCSNDEVCEYDILINESEKMNEHKEEFEALENMFMESYYASYYTFDEYLYLAYGVKNDYEMMYRYYVKSSLQPLLIYDRIQAEVEELIGLILDYREPFLENYFSLEVNHVLVYVDRNEDNYPDNYHEYVNSLDATELMDFNVLLADLEIALIEYDGSFSSLVQEYKNASLDNDIWGPFKSYGLHFLTEPLGELTYDSTNGMFAEEFVDALIDLYGEYTLDQNIDKESMPSGLFTTQFGIHIIEAEKGDYFDKPEFNFTITELIEYTEYRFTELFYGIENLDDIYGGLTSYISPENLELMESHLGDIYDSLFTVAYLNSIIIDQLLEANYINSNSVYSSLTEIEFYDSCNNFLDIYTYIVFGNHIT